MANKTTDTRDELRAEPGRAPLLLYLAEGNSETPESWSGCSAGLVSALRAAGASVRTTNVLPGRVGRWLSLALTFRPERERWIANYHSGQLGFRMRSRRARLAVERGGAGHVVVQAGATFSVSVDLCRRFVYCDANAMFAARGGPYSSVAALSRRELRRVIERERRIYEGAAGIFTFSDALRRSFIEDFAIAPERVRTVHAGSNLASVPEDHVLSRRSDGRAPTILFVGKAFERKGGPDLLEAFRLVRSAIPDACLMIAGAAPDATPEGVQVIGYVDPKHTGPGSLSELYARADVFCMPSRYEPFGVVFVEAMLHGLPCVGIDAWAMPEIIAHEQTGWICPRGNVPALARTLIAALSDRERLRGMGARGRSVALSRFTWARVAEAMLGTIQGSGPRRA